MRWVSYVASSARDKQAKGIVPMKRLFAISRGINDKDCDSEQEPSVSDAVPGILYPR